MNNYRDPRITVAIVLLVAAIGLITFAIAAPCEANAHEPPLTAAQLEQAQLRTCAVRHRPADQWQARAACKVVVVWRGTWTERREAVRVAWCEDRLSSGDRRGTYWGAYQQDADARATYGFGPTIVDQARSADKMHAARGWQPWPNCKPTGSAHALRWAEAPRSVRQYG